MKRSIAILLFVLLLLIGCLASCSNEKRQQTPVGPTNVITTVDHIETIKDFYKIAKEEHDVFEFYRLSTSDSLGPREKIIGKREIRQASCIIDGTRYYILYYSDDVHRYVIGDILCIDYQDIDYERHTIYSQNALLYFGVHKK